MKTNAASLWKRIRNDARTADVEPLDAINALHITATVPKHAGDLTILLRTQLLNACYCEGVTMKCKSPKQQYQTNSSCGSTRLNTHTHTHT